ncbi:hypothetical protein AnigIFM56816_006257 [Aspergillus niger]|nr:hypothetical protein AnigIFM56816_006257 [Aspergillus niger]
MSRVVHQDPKTQPVQEGQNEPVQDAIPHGDDALDGSVETNNAKEEYGVQDEADFEVRFESVYALRDYYRLKRCKWNI